MHHDNEIYDDENDDNCRSMEKDDDDDVDEDDDYRSMVMARSVKMEMLTVKHEVKELKLQFFLKFFFFFWISLIAILDFHLQAFCEGIDSIEANMFLDWLFPNMREKNPT